MSLVIGVGGRRVRLMEGWNTITGTLGAHYFERERAVRFSSHRGQWLKLDVYELHAEGYLPPRGILTVRHDSPPPTLGLLRPSGYVWDYNGPGGYGIAPCGEGTLHDHDAMMQRCPVSLAQMGTGRNPSAVSTWGTYALVRGWHRSSTLPGYSEMLNPGDQYDNRTKPARVGDIKDLALAQAVDDWYAPDGQHLIRAYRHGILHKQDPVVQLDLRALAQDASLAWDEARVGDILRAPAGVGHGDVGREFGWVAYLAGMLGHRALIRRMRPVVGHVQNPAGMLQRLHHGWFFGSPDPWGQPPFGSGVPEEIDVAQDIEAAVLVVGLDWLGCPQAALRLWRACLARPAAKWLATDTAQPVGQHGADVFHPWFALGTVALLARQEAQEAALRWRVPTPGGSLAGPFGTLVEVRQALAAWGDLGKARWALERI